MGLASPAQAETRRIVTGWLPGWAAQAALAATTANADLFNEATPFWYTATASGGSVALDRNVTDQVASDTLTGLRSAGIPVLPSVADGSSARAMAAVLADPTSRSAHVGQLVGLVVSSGFDGIELDYEKFAFKDGSSTWASTRPNWVSFVTELGAALHAQGKRLALAVPPSYGPGQTSAAGYWVYDLAAIAGSVDSLRIMSYDYSVAAPGPIAPLAFVRKSMGWVATVVPAAKLRLGIPAYGRVWTARNPDGSAAITGTCPSGAVPATASFTTANAITYLTQMAGTPVAPTWNAEYGELNVTFTKTYTGTDSAGSATSCQVTHTAWWVDAQGAVARMQIMDSLQLGGAAFWQLAGVDAATWAALRSYAGGTVPTPAPTPSPTPTASPTPTPTPTPSKAATGVVVAGPTSTKANKKIKLKVTVQSGGGPLAKSKVSLARRYPGAKKWVSVATARTNSKGVATFKVTAKRTATWRARVAGSAKRSAGAGTLKVPVVARVTATASTLNPQANHEIRLTARVVPAAAGITVVRQRLIAQKWTSLGSAVTSAAGDVVFRVTPGQPATDYVYRFVAVHPPAVESGTSATLRVRTRAT